MDWVWKKNVDDTKLKCFGGLVYQLQGMWLVWLLLFFSFVAASLQYRIISVFFRRSNYTSLLLQFISLKFSLYSAERLYDFLFHEHLKTTYLFIPFHLSFTYRVVYQCLILNSNSTPTTCSTVTTKLFIGLFLGSRLK